MLQWQRCWPNGAAPLGRLMRWICLKRFHQGPGEPGTPKFGLQFFMLFRRNLGRHSVCSRTSTVSGSCFELLDLHHMPCLQDSVSQTNHDTLSAASEPPVPQLGRIRAVAHTAMKKSYLPKLERSRCSITAIGSHVQSRS